MRCLPRLACFLVALFSAAPANAAPPPPELRLEIDVHALHAAGNFDGRQLDTAPAFRAADMRFKGAGRLTGGGMRLLGLYERHLRVGWGVSFFAVSDVGLAHAPLGPDLHIAGGKPWWGAEIELFGGYAIELGRFMPYLDLRVGAQFVKTGVAVRSAELGDVQTLKRQITLPLVAPRAGVKIRLAGPVALDIAGSVSPLGFERASIFAGLSLFLGETRRK